jgi:hypothetical protein
MDITEEELQECLSSYLPSCNLVILAIGNLTKASAARLGQDLEDIFKDLPVCKSRRPMRCADLPAHTRFLLRTPLEPLHVNSSLLVYKHGGESTPRQMVLVHLVTSLL